MTAREVGILTLILGGLGLISVNIYLFITVKRGKSRYLLTRRLLNESEARAKAFHAVDEFSKKHEPTLRIVGEEEGDHPFPHYTTDDLPSTERVWVKKIRP